MIEVESALNGGEGGGIGGVLDGQGHVHKLEDAYARRHRPLHFRVLHSHVSDRFEEALYVHGKCHQQLLRQVSLEGQASPEYDNQDQGQGADNFHDGQYSGRQPAGVEAGVQVATVQVAELLQVQVFPSRALHDSDPGDVLLQRSVHRRYSSPDAQVRFSGELLPVVEEQEQEREHG